VAALSRPPVSFPDYYLIGMVDGLSTQLDCHHACASQWRSETIVSNI
jgi:hypothetical protein